ncbi:hypothetical protein FS842_009458, partial [Serendipita sp. 407]
MAFQVRFERLGNREDLDTAMSTLKRADELTQKAHPSRPLCHYSLGDALRLRFDHFGDLKNLEDAITRLQNSVDLSPDGDPYKPTFLNGLGRALLSLFGHHDKREYLENAISNLDKAVKLTPDGAPRQPHHLHNLGNALRARFEYFGNMENLEESVSILEKACEVTPDGHPDRAIHLNGLGVALLVRFERNSKPQDLTRAISVLQNADKLMLDVNPSKPSVLNNRGRALQAGYEHMHKLEDLNNMIRTLQKAVEHTDGHPSDFSRLFDLAAALQERFEVLGSPADLESLISCLQKVVALLDEGHPDRPNCLNVLGKAQKARFERLGNFADLDRSISNLGEGVKITADSDPYKPHRLSNLGSAYSLSASRRNIDQHLQEAISAQDKAVQLTPSDHPNKVDFLISYGDALYNTSNSTRNPKNRKAAVEAFTQAAKSAVGRPKRCFDAAIKWAQCCRDASEPAMDAYTCAIKLLPRIASLGLAVADQHALLAEVGSVVRDAVASAIQSKRHVTAVEWAEHGRSIVWQNLLSLRAPLNDLRRNHEELANSLEKISQQMEEPHGDAPLGSKGPKQSSDQVVTKYLTLAREWEAILKEIRSKPNFESFLQPNKFDELQVAADDGPVVILNVQDSRCDALILISDGESFTIRVIPLKNFSYQKSQKLLRNLRAVLASSKVRARNLRTHKWAGVKAKLAENRRGHKWADPKADTGEGLEGVLRTLWTDVVKPVIKGLGYKVDLVDPPHIWWCPMGPLAFLPIHAAGLYNQDVPGHKVSDYVVSSYAPTLTTILRKAHNLEGPLQLLTVALPSTPYASSLPYTEDEIKRIQRLATGLSLVELMGESATV